MNKHWQKFRDILQDYSVHIIAVLVLITTVGATITIEGSLTSNDTAEETSSESGSTSLEVEQDDDEGASQSEEHDKNEQSDDRSTLERSGPYTVHSVVDGDTINVDTGDTVEPVRLIGIDTPEVDSPYTDEECYGLEASARATELLDGQQVYLKSDSSQDNRDVYDRLLRYVVLDDTNINQLLIDEGYAFEYTFREAYYYQDEFKQSERQASDANRGLWAADTCDGDVALPEESAPEESPQATEQDGCIMYDQAPNHVGEYTCVTGVVDHVFVSRTDTTFINFCSDYRTCPFYSVIFESDQHQFSSIEQLEGQQVNITGTIDTHEGRPQIILNEPSQLVQQ